MRCPRSANSQKVKRAGMKCKRCQYEFILHPKRYPFLTDGKAVAFGTELSRNDERAFTPRQLFGAAAARRRLVWWSRTARQLDVDDTVAALARLSEQLPRQFRENGDCVSSRRCGHRAVAGTGHLRLRSGADPGGRRSGRRRPPRRKRRPHQRSRRGDRPVWLPDRDHRACRALVRDRPDVPVAMLHASNADPAALATSIRTLLGASAPVTDLGIDPGVISRLQAVRWARRLDRLPLDALPHWLLTGPLVEAMITNSPIAASLSTTRDGATSYVDLAYYIVASDGDYG